MYKYAKLSIIILFLVIKINAQVLKNEGKNDTLTYQINPITVTATRYIENIIEIPYAVSIIGANQLSNVKGYGLDEVLNSVPGVLTQSRAGTQDVRIVIRGFGARGAGDRSNSGTSRGIRVMVDGMPETEPDGRTSFDQIDLSEATNIEVIRSNASALWGNAAGGIVNVSTVPNFEGSFINLKGFTGSYGFNKYTINAGTQFENGKLYGSFSKSLSDGWREHSASTRSVVNVGFISNLSDVTKLGVFVLGSSNLFHIPGPLSKAEYDYNPELANSTYKNRDERRYNRLGRMGVTFEHEINENHEISSMVYVNPKYLQRSERGTFRDFTRYHIGGNFVYRNKVNFSENLKNSLSIGLDEAYQDGAILFYSLSSTNGRGSTLKDNKREGANNFGAFVQNELRINEKVSLLVGGRYDNVTYYSESYIDNSLGLQDKSFEHFTPKAGLTYMFTPSHSLYFNLGGGVEVPAGNETDPAGTYGQDTVYAINPLLEPILSTTYEVGTKQVFYFGKQSLLQSLTYDAALYYISIKNDIIPYKGGRFYFTAGKTHRTGFELGANFQFSHGVSIGAAFTYAENKYDDYTVDSVHYGNAGKYANYKDKKAAGIPEMFYSTTITYAPEFLYGAFVSFTFNGMGKYFVDDANSIEVPSYNIINATVGTKDLCLIKNYLNVKGFFTVNNLTDQKYVASAFINPDLVNGSPVYIEPGLPQNFVLSLSFGIK
ncbi:MAG: TonB-dependent receptor [bacterium]